MITSDQCMETILQKFPGFKTAWKNHLEWWEGDIPGLSNDMSVFSDYVQKLLEIGGDIEELKDIFLFIEELLKEGDSDVKNAVATCFLENLINAISWKRITAKTFVSLLGEESKKYCKAWDEFTGVKTDKLWEDKNV